MRWTRDSLFGALLCASACVLHPGGLPPVINSSPVTAAQVGQTYSYQVLADDPTSDGLGYALSSSPIGMQIDVNGLITWTPAAPGTVPVSLTVSNTWGSAVQAYSVAVSPASTPPPSYRNGVWLSYNHGESSAQYAQSAVNDLATRLHASYNVDSWFLNVGHVDSTGRIVNVPPHLTDFLSAVASWESANQVSLHLIAWLNGATDPATNTSAVDVSLPSVRGAVVAETQKLVSTSVPGSYVLARPLDGVQIDFEPSGDDASQPGRFEGLSSLMDEMRAGFAAVNRPSAWVSLAAPQIGSASAWRFTPQQYYELAPKVDLLALMAYDTQLATGADYQARVQQQVNDILRAIQGESFNDGQHLPPASPSGLLVGLPAYAQTANHDPAVENVAAGAQGLTSAVSALTAGNDPAARNLAGAAVYLHNDGTGTDGYAGWSTDWADFASFWLGK
jgi:hypothetical protein